MLDELDRTVRTFRAVSAGVPVWAGAAIRPVVSSTAARPESTTLTGGATNAARPALRIGMNGTGGDGLSDHHDVPAAAALAAFSAISADGAIAALSTIARRIPVVRGYAAGSARPAIAAAPAGSAVTAAAAEGENVDAHDEIVDLEVDVAAVRAILAVRALRSGLAISAAVPVAWRIVPVPMVYAVLPLLAGLTRLAGRAMDARVSVCAFGMKIRHVSAPTRRVM
jgi:hypothetical protein